MTNRSNKVEKMNSQEAYQYGIDKGFGKALGFCISFIKENRERLMLDKISENAVISDLREFVLERKRKKDGST